MFKDIQNLIVYYMENIEEEKIPLNVELTEQEKEICDANVSEVIAYYLFNPNLFLTHLYDSLTTMTWKFYFFNKNN